jgi:hypothetical protein
MPREWNTPHREKWTAPIHQILKAIDNHTSPYIWRRVIFGTKNKHKYLENMSSDVKVWIHKEENWEL